MVITHNIIQMMGGTIQVESKLGEGSRFEVILPIEQDKTADRSIRSRQVVVIGASEDNEKEISYVTEKTPVQVWMGSSEEEERKYLKEHNVHIILLSCKKEHELLKAEVEDLREHTGED